MQFTNFELVLLESLIGRPYVGFVADEQRNYALLASLNDLLVKAFLLCGFEASVEDFFTRYQVATNKSEFLTNSALFTTEFKNQPYTDKWTLANEFLIDVNCFRPPLTPSQDISSFYNLLHDNKNLVFPLPRLDPSNPISVYVDCRDLASCLDGVYDNDTPPNVLRGVRNTFQHTQRIPSGVISKISDYYVVCSSLFSFSFSRSI
jgi:hypothetical protein